MKIQIAQIRNKYETNYTNKKKSHKRHFSICATKHEQEYCYFFGLLNPRLFRAVLKLVGPA